MNLHMQEEANEFYNYMLNSSLNNKEQRYTFLISNYNHFSSLQISEIKKNLETTISIQDKHYHHIVSLYKLSSQIDNLKTTLQKDLFTRLHDTNKIGNLDKKEINELKNISVLVSLGYYPEHRFIEEINNLYQIYRKKRELEYFQFYILTNSIAILNSKKSITETLHMLNETQESTINHYQDVIHLGYSYYYFNICIAPKMRDRSLKEAIYNDKQLKIHKAEIIYKILNDDSFWKEHVKIE